MQKKEEEIEATLRFASISISGKRLAFVLVYFFEYSAYSAVQFSVFRTCVPPISQIVRVIKMRSP